MSEEARKKRAEYMKAYRSRNRERLNAAQREYTRQHPERRRLYNERYWEKKAAEAVGGEL